MTNLTVAWFSAGVSSAVATKLVLDKVDIIKFINIADHHPDTMRFLKDCEKWYDKEIEIITSSYESVENVCLATQYVNGPKGAACTRLLKKRPRKKWEAQLDKNIKLTYIWGLDAGEAHRMDRIKAAMPKFNHLFPLIDNNLDKSGAHEILKASGIKRPAMYDLGYNNNNCIGCIKGGMGYFNKIRVDFPEVFKARALMEREIGRSCIKGVFLDELDPERGRMSKEILDDCGMFCELIKI